MKNQGRGVVKSDGFYSKSKLSYVDRFGMQSDKNNGCFIYEWDEKEKKHVKNGLRNKN